MKLSTHRECSDAGRTGAGDGAVVGVGGELVAITMVFVPSAWRRCYSERDCGVSAGASCN